MLTQEIEAISNVAHSQPTADHWLRLARWQSWAHSLRDAADSADHAVQLDPDSIPGHELLASLAAENEDREAAAREYGRLATLDPARKDRWLRELANLRIEDGDFDRAIAALRETAARNPGSIAALTDLALAQQRAERWYEAQETWERAYALPAATPQQRAEVRRPLLATLERLGEAPRALEIIQAAVDSAANLPDRQELFHQLVDFCRKHNFTAELTRRYEDRLALQRQDYFLLTALAELRQTAGLGDEAYTLLSRAQYSSPDSAATLRTLVDLAEKSGNLDAAIGDQRRLVAMTHPAPSDALEKLASLQSANLDDEAAAATWEELCAKFPRDAGVLGRAADFFESAGNANRARALLRQLAGFAADDVRRTLRLGQLDLAAGDAASARRSFEDILQRSEPGKDDDQPQTPPLPGSPGVKGATAPVRLTAIRELAQILPTAARADWIARWTKAADAGARNEPLWALYGAGAKAETGRLLARWAAERPGNDAVEQLLVRVGLRIGDYAGVARWTWSGKPPDPERGERMLEGLAQFLMEGGEPEPRLLTELFPADCPRDLRWKAASVVFAGRQHFAEAIALGIPVLDQTSANRANYALELAGWDLLLGRAGDARAVLRRAVDEGGADTMEPTGDQFFAAIREYWTLLPEGERKPFAESLLLNGSTRGGPAQQILTRALLHGLLGQAAAANADLDDLVKLRMLTGDADVGSTDARRWGYLLVNGAQFTAWNLDQLAIHLWRRALAEASPFQWQDTECRGVLNELRSRLAGAEIVDARDPQAALERVDDYLRARPDPAGARTLAGQLMASARPVEAVRVDEYLIDVDHAEAEHVRNLLDALAAADDRPALQRRLRQLLAAGDLASGLQTTDLAMRLAAELERDGDTDGACRVLARQYQANPRAIPVGLALARSEDRAGRTDRAVAVLRDLLPKDASARVALAEIEARRGNADAAIAALKECVPRAGDPARATAIARLINLLFAKGDRAAALELAHEPAVAFAAGAQAGSNPWAKDLFAIALRRATDPAVRFAAQRALLGFASPADFPKACKRLERLAGEDSGRLDEFEEVRYKLAVARGLTAWLEGELKTAWADGRGRPSAGVKLVELYLLTKGEDRLRDTVKTMAARTVAWEPAAFAAQAALTDGGHAALALPLAERLARHLPQTERYSLAWLRALWKSGDQAGADAVAQELSALAVIRGNVDERLAHTFSELGATDRALTYYRRAAAGDGSTAGRLALASLEMPDLPAARADLLTAYRNSDTADLSPLVDWLEAAGQLASSRRAPGADFPLSVKRRGDLAVMVFDRLWSRGKTEDARHLALSHPELLAAAPELAGRLHAASAPADRAAVAAALETAVAQSDPPPPRLERELAELCVERAAAEPAEAGALLSRAHALRPEDFAIARKLAENWLADKQPAKADEALQAFLAADALPEERSAAQQTMGFK